MTELFDTLAGETIVFGYSVPVLRVIAAALWLVGIFCRSVPVSMPGGLLVITSYVMSAAALTTF
jgi:hypothetical protein